MSDERLYSNLPAVYRLRDGAIGEPLRALLGVMETQLTTLRNDIGALFDNWFIETCDEWVVPYIGDLLGVRSQYIFDNTTMTLRPFIANTLRYRRKKGTAAMLEGLAADVTGWRARAVEFFQLLGTTQYLNHIRRKDLRTPDLRDTNALELLGGPFERSMRFAEVRRVSTGTGKYNIGNVGIFLWRLKSLEVDRAPAIRSVADGPFCYRFSQLGADSHLFNRARTTTARVVESDMPGPLRPRAVFDELEAARAALSAGKTPQYHYFDDEPSFTVYRDGEPFEPKYVQICDLSGWTTPPTAESVTLPPPDAPLVCQVSVDPKLGRLIFLDGKQPTEGVHVTYFRGFSADIGGGSYARVEGTAPGDHSTTYPVKVVDPSQPADDGFVNALTSWEGEISQPNAVFLFQGPNKFGDSINHPDDPNKGSGIFKARDFTVPSGSTVILEAADGSQPLIRLTTPWTITLEEDATLVFNGLMVAGEPIRIVTTNEPTSPAGDLQHTFTIEDCTIVPGLLLDAEGLPMVPDAVCLSTLQPSEGALTVNVMRSIVGRVDLSPGSNGFTGKLYARDSIFDGTGAAALTINAPGGADLGAVTVLGKTAVGSLDASDCIFDQPLTTTRTQIGCVRFSFVPDGSTTPRAYRCQPALALTDITDPVEQAPILHRILPSYTSQRYGDPGYVQLARACPVEISAGAEFGKEMGAFNSLMQPQRLANLQTSLDEYLRFGLEAGVFLVT
jgi:hypothetical protein